ncbi:hypothetical protein CJ030_MR0G004674 [Morella rubra]|uniref:TPX2 C-terminal domain-containing protein n=1 Tax=Morella rubra TaxID=262757 RepID=A0A6A1ULW5_9ROSI|nr:hypothetical protein CJ030_MR0G004674 [Morella rubra]
MGESACLVRSLSHPCDSSSEAKEVSVWNILESLCFGILLLGFVSLLLSDWVLRKDGKMREHGKLVMASGPEVPGDLAVVKLQHLLVVSLMRWEQADRESISFGRFMSDSLAWEKWSTFSHNRYLEEVEKFSKVGSVAQKKAYFEAHYKKKAAERAAALPDEVNAAAHNGPESETKDKPHEDSFMDSELVDADGHRVIDEPHHHYAPNTAGGHSAYWNNPNIGEFATMKVEAAEALNREGFNVVDTSTLAGRSDQIEKVEKCQKIIVAPQEDKKLNKDAVCQDILASPSKTRQTNSTLKLSTQSRAPKLPVSPAKQMVSKQSRNRTNGSAESKRTAADIVDKKRSAKSLHMSINFASFSGKTSKTISPAFHEVGTRRTDATLFHTSKHVSSTTLQTSTRRLEEKINSKEAEKGQLQTKPKEKPQLRQSTDFKAKPNKDLNHGSQQPSPMKKNPQTWPQSPKLGRKPTPTAAQDLGSRPPRRPSGRSASSNHVMEKVNQTTICSITTTRNKSALENASPNIQR